MTGGDRRPEATGGDRSGVKYVTAHTKIRVFRSVFTHQKNTAKIRQIIRTSEYCHVGQGGWPPSSCSLHATRSHAGGRPAARASRDEVVCVLADAFGFESADDYGRANEATLSRLRAQARRARALAKVNAFVSRHGLAFSPPISPPISPPAISEQQVQVDNEVLDWLQRRLDSAQRILSHVRLDRRTGLLHRDAARRVSHRCRNAADRARRVRLRRRSFLPLRPPLRRTSRWRMSSSVCSTRQRRTRHHISMLRNSSSSSSGNGNGCLRLTGSGDFSRRTEAAWSAWELRFEGRRCFKAQRRWRFFLKWPLICPDLRQYGNTDRNTRNTPRPRPKKIAYFGPYSTPEKIRKKRF